MLVQDTTRIGKILTDAYGLQILGVKQIPGEYYNAHYVAESPSGSLHVKVYRGADGLSHEDRVATVRYAHQVVDGLVRSSCPRIISYRTTIGGDSLFASDIVLDVADQVATSGRKIGSSTLASVLAELHTALKTIGVKERPGGPDFRFESVGRSKASMPAILEKQTRSAPERIRNGLDASLRSFYVWLEKRSAEFRPTMIHGDYGTTNVLDNPSGNCYVFDFDCAYVDLCEIDVAHGLLSCACSGYFSGAFDFRAAQDFLDGYNATSGQPSVSLDVASYLSVYTVLKKICLVRKSEHLYLDKRLHLIDDLTRMR